MTDQIYQKYSHKLINGREIRDQLIASLDSNMIAKAGKLMILLASDDEPAQMWTRNKIKLANSIGLAAEIIDYGSSVSNEDITSDINTYNRDPAVSGILVQLPLYQHLESSRSRILAEIDPAKDVDGLSPSVPGRISFGLSTYQPATVMAVQAAIAKSLNNDLYTDATDLDLAGKNVVIINHSNLIGRPLAMCLLNCKATVSVCHEHTKDLFALTAVADILITAAGVPGLLDHSSVKAGATVIDVTTIRNHDGYVGDVELSEELMEKVAHITPVPGGIGPMTIGYLLYNLVRSI